MGDRRQKIEDTVDDLVGSFLYYDRKEDENLPMGEIEAAIRSGELTSADIVAMFETHLRAGLKERLPHG